ncbi:response regulator [Desulfovibrio sp. JC010]|uniref:response regulator n=1 Tax=Desulfovibrio sp. JC010 TaxID=2593641 RepID=UPI0013D4D064|nr:response regulator [Desulfovibrio sp. JC010]NDV27829.1 response regulator [Desulfovibrio sp. JC010]
MDRIRVLLVDDEVDFSRVLARRLGRRGLNVITASGADEAVLALKEHPVDVVLLDIKMPGRDGVQLLGEIKRQYPGIAVVMLTAHAESDLIISCMAMGACDYLLKPTDADEIVLKLKDAALGCNNQ